MAVRAVVRVVPDVEKAAPVAVKVVPDVAKALRAATAPPRDLSAHNDRHGVPSTRNAVRGVTLSDPLADLVAIVQLAVRDQRVRSDQRVQPSRP
jgi:hypothetical protein